MSVALRTARPFAPAPSDAGQQLLLRDVSWQQYAALREVFQDRAALRMTYDQGELEIMKLSPDHERYKVWLGRFIEVLVEETNRSLAMYGSMTFQDGRLLKGLEADNCFWIAHEAIVRMMQVWVADRDPPPDLALEIEVSRSALDRMGIYAAIRVPEVWRFNGTLIRICLLQADGSYREVKHSPTFPGIPIKGIVPFLARDPEVDYLSAVRAFRAWVKKHLAKKKKSKE